MAGPYIVCFEEKRSWYEIVNVLYPAVETFLLDNGINPKDSAFSIRKGIFCIEFADQNMALLFKLTF